MLKKLTKKNVDKEFKEKVINKKGIEILSLCKLYCKDDDPESFAMWKKVVG